LSRTELAKQALEKSLEIREEYRYDFRSPLCVYQLAEKSRVTVRFIDDVSMEGVYAALAKPKILISSLRPAVRRVFTCAHELAHHFFGHGSTIDELQDEAESGQFQPNEFLANAFAGFLLMPAQGVKRAFSLRGLNIATATPEQVYGSVSDTKRSSDTSNTHSSCSRPTARRHLERRNFQKFVRES
jgi:Zn-dependent peptidase ImmA (M78 family)